MTCLIRFVLLVPCLAAAAWPQTGFYRAAKHGGNYMYNYYLPPAPSSYPWAPDWSPDGKSLAISLQGSIWKVDPSSGEAVELTHNGRYHSSPDWSPDGRWIIYTADEDHRRIQLEILNVATGESHALTDDEHLYLDPVFSPDGSRVAYVSTSPNGYFNIYVRPIRDGAWSGPAVALTKDHRYPRDRLYFGPWDMPLQPAWLSGGNEILFLSNRGIPLGSGDIWRMPAVADGIGQARSILNEQSLYRARPDVSVDGKRFIYSSSGGAADQFNHLYVLPVAGGSPYKMTFGDHDDFHPRWSPDGEHIAYISNEGGLPHLVVMETYGGKKTHVRLKSLRWKRPMTGVTIEVVDEAGRLTPARIRLRASDGKFYAPLETYSRLGMYAGHLFHTEGLATVGVPPGRLEVTAVKGFEHWPAHAELVIGEGKLARVRLALKRLANLPAKGWYGGSTHVHMNYGGNLRNTLENIMLMSRAENLQVAGVLAANKDNRVFDWMYFEPGGGEHSVSRSSPDIIVIVGQEYRPPFWGHVFYLGLNENLISPFLTGYEGTGVESLYPSNTDMFRKARAQGAVAGYVHPWSGDGDPLDGSLGGGKSFPVDLALGTVDAYEWSSSSRGQYKVWAHALNNDLRVTPVGGEDSISNLHISKLVGSLRTYAYLGEDFTAAGWLSALRQGRTFFTGGPLLEFEIDGKKPGEAIQLGPDGGRLKLRASVWSIAPLSRVVVYHNGKPLLEVPINEEVWSGEPAADGRCAQLDTEIAVKASGWYSLYAEGPHTELLDVEYPQAATNAIRVYVGEQKIRNRASAEYFLRWIDKLKTMAEEWPWWRSQKERDHVFAQLDEARRVYQRLAAEAQQPDGWNNRGELRSKRNLNSGRKS